MVVRERQLKDDHSAGQTLEGLRQRHFDKSQFLAASALPVASWLHHSVSGSNYFVRILSTLNRELLKPNCSVALHRHSHAVVDILPPEADSTAPWQMQMLNR